MPKGTCNYPHHHSGGSSAGPPIGLLLAIGAGVLVVTHMHAAASALRAVVIVTLAVVAVLAVAGVAVALLVRSHRAEPYDAAWSDTEPQDVPPVTVSARLLQARVDQLEQQLAERRAIEAPQQHLHLHGISADEIAVALARHNHPQAVIEE